VVLVQRIAFVSVLVVGLVLVGSPAQARQVTHTFSSFSGDFVSPAGSVCDFTLEEVFSGKDNNVVFGNPDDPDKVIVYEEITITHKNLDTGYNLTEVDHYVASFDRADATFKNVGLVWHLRTPDGKIVVVQAGLEKFDTDTGELIKITPAVNPDGAQVICPALGGSPA
jgi:hypothetical protein